MKIFSTTPSKLLLVAKRIFNMVTTEAPIEFGCLLVSYFLSLYTKQSGWLYFGIALTGILHCTNGTKYYLGSPIFYIPFLACAYYTRFPNTLLLTSMLTALTCLCLYKKERISTRIYHLGKHFFIALYCTAFIILALVLLYIIASILITMPNQLKEILGHACIFAFAVILPTLFLAIDKSKHETTTIPTPIRWLQFIVETLIQVGVLYFVFCILQMTFRSLTPRPYVIYIVIALIIIIEISAKLHDWTPLNWNNLFFSHRNLLYIPLIFLGIAALYVEISIVGHKPRTLAASILIGWISTICIARLINCRSITVRERPISLYISIILLIAIYTSAVINLVVPVMR